MLQSQFSGPLHSPSRQSTTRIASLVLVTLTIAILTMTLTPKSFAQSSLSPGTLTNNSPSQTCSGSLWFTYQDTAGTVHTMTCIPATVSNCLNGAYAVPDINLIYASLSPVGIISGVSAANGVVVYFTGGDGMHPADGATGVAPNDLDYIKS